MTPPVHELWLRIEQFRTRPGTQLPDLHRLTPEDLGDDAIRAATVVELAGLGTDRLTVLLDLRDALASGAVDGWADAWAAELI